MLYKILEMPFAFFSNVRKYDGDAGFICPTVVSSVLMPWRFPGTCIAVGSVWMRALSAEYLRWAYSLDFSKVSRDISSCDLPSEVESSFSSGEEIIQVYVSDHRCLQKISLTVIAVGVIPYVHVPRNAHQYRVNVDGAEQGGEQYAAVHAVDLRRSQSVFQRPYTLGIDYVAR